MTLWTFVRHDEHAPPPDPRELGRSLRELHAALADFPGDLAPLSGVRDWLERLLVELRPSPSVTPLETSRSCLARVARTCAGQTRHSCRSCAGRSPPHYRGRDHEHGQRWLRDQLPSGGDVFVSIDCDGLDPSVAPPTGWPQPGGLTFGHVAAVIAEPSRTSSIVGGALVELLPSRDLNALTALTATRLLMLVADGRGRTAQDRD